MKNLGLKIENNKILAPLTTFNIGGIADYFCSVEIEEQMIKAVNWAKANNLKFFILGGGSNVLISDEGIRGLAIRNKMLGIKSQGSKVVVKSGVLLSKLIQYSMEHSLSGLEFLTGIPGTVGGAIFGNAGTGFGSISQRVTKIRVLTEDSKIIDLTAKDCYFEYRTSRFQKNKEIILSVVFELKKEKQAIIRKKINDALLLRKNQPKGNSAGCIFKNPSLASAGYLIENAGLKGLKIGEAIVSREHANWIINLGGVTAENVLKLILLIKKKVKESFKVNLEEEIRLIGEFNNG